MEATLIEKLVRLDQQLFVSLQAYDAPWLDACMVFVTNKYNWAPAYLLLLGWMAYNYRKAAIFLVLQLLAGIGLADYLASGICKPFFARLRPCHDPAVQEYIRELVGCGGQFGFVSSHASTSAALALGLSLLLPKYRVLQAIAWVWAFVYSYSRIHVGVHYPADVVGGWLIGWFSAFVAVWLVNRFFPALRLAD